MFFVYFKGFSQKSFVKYIVNKGDTLKKIENKDLYKDAMLVNCNYVP